MLRNLSVNSDWLPRWSGALASLAVFGCQCAVAEGLRAPGFAWAEVRYPGSEQRLEQDDLVFESSVHQGLELFKLSERDRLNLFGRLRYLTDSDEIDFNSKAVFSLGGRLVHQVSDSAVVSAGALYEFDRRFRTDRNLKGSTLFMDGYGTWKLSQRNPGEFWAELRYPASHDPLEEEDLIFEGVLEQGIDWSRIGEQGRFNTFAILEWQYDSEGLDYYRSLAGGLGVKLRFPMGDAGLLQIGAKYLIDRRWESRVTEDGVIGFLSWSTAWDARTIRRHLPD